MLASTTSVDGKLTVESRARELVGLSRRVVTDRATIFTSYFVLVLSRCTVIQDFQKNHRPCRTAPRSSRPRNVFGRRLITPKERSLQSAAWCSHRGTPEVPGQHAARRKGVTTWHRLARVTWRPATITWVRFRKVPAAHADSLRITQIHSITSLACASSICGMARPSAFAVFRLITSSYLLG
jgi:hypothetical protein